MYRIIKTDGTELGMTESPFYIRVTDEGCYAPCEKDKAVGVAFDSTAYNLFGHEDIADAETVLVSEVDGGNMLAEQKSATDELILSVLEG